MIMIVMTMIMTINHLFLFDAIYGVVNIIEPKLLLRLSAILMYN